MSSHDGKLLTLSSDIETILHVKSEHIFNSSYFIKKNSMSFFYYFSFDLMCYKIIKVMKFMCVGVGFLAFVAVLKMIDNLFLYTIIL